MRVLPSRLTASLRARASGSVVSVALIAASSLVGAALFTVSVLGRSAPLSASRTWLLLLCGSWAFLLAWALLYARFIWRNSRTTWERGLYWAALCHIPLLLCLSPLAAVYGSDLANHAYSSTPHGMMVYQPLSRGYVILSPLLAQAAVLCCYHRDVVVRALPVAGIATASLGLRLWNLDWGLPGLLHPDEHQYIGRAFLMMGTGDLNPHYFENPSLMIYITYTLYRLLSQQAQPFHVVADFFQWAVQDPRGDYLVVLSARAFSAAAGALTAMAVYQVGKELFGRSAGLLGAALLGASFLHVRDSHYATNDVLATAFLALSLLYSVRIYQRGRPSDYLLAALFGGLGTSAKYNVGVFAVAVVAAHLARQLNRDGRSGRARGYLLLAASGAMSLAAFVAGTPYAVLDSATFLSGFHSQFQYGAAPWRGQAAVASPLLFLSTLAQGFGVVPLALFGLGSVLAIRRDWRALAVILSAPTAYLLFMSTQRLFFARFAIPLLPFLAIPAGHAIDQSTKVMRSTLRPVGITLLATLALAQPLPFSLQSDALLGREDTRWLAARWIDANVPSSASMAMESYAQLDGKFGWRGHRVSNLSVFWPENQEATAHALNGPYNYVVVTSFGYGPWQKEGDLPSLLPIEYNALQQRGRLAAIFAPGPDNQEIPYSQDDVYTPFWHLFDRVRDGPTIRIYEMSEGAPQLSHVAG